MGQNHCSFNVYDKHWNTYLSTCFGNRLPAVLLELFKEVLNQVGFLSLPWSSLASLLCLARLYPHLRLPLSGRQFQSWFFPIDFPAFQCRKSKLTIKWKVPSVKTRWYSYHISSSLLCRGFCFQIWMQQKIGVLSIYSSVSLQNCNGLGFFCF